MADSNSNRSPDDAKIKQKMLFASSRDALRRALVGIHAEVQGTDPSEVAFEAGKSLISLPLSHSTLRSFGGRCLSSADGQIYRVASEVTASHPLRPDVGRRSGDALSFPFLVMSPRKATRADCFPI